MLRLVPTLLDPKPLFPLNCRIREHITGVLRGHEQEVCGLKWSPSGTQLASGGNDNLLHIWSATGAHAFPFAGAITPCPLARHGSEVPVARYHQDAENTPRQGVGSTSK